jgi:hypothetical protein
MNSMHWNLMGASWEHQNPKNSNLSFPPKKRKNKKTKKKKKKKNWASRIPVAWSGWLP